MSLSIGIQMGFAAYRAGGNAVSRALQYLATDANTSSGAVSEVTPIYAPNGSALQATGSRQPSISSGVITFDGTSDVLEPEYAGPNTSSGSNSLPDNVSGTDAGKGFTITGLHRLTDGRWACGNFGENVIANPGAPASSIVILSSDFSTAESEFLLSDYSLSGGIQGVTQDGDGNIWAAVITDDVLLCVDPSDGSEVTRLSLAYEPNGLAWDSLTSELIVQDVAASILRWITTGGTAGKTKAVTGTAIDMLHFDPAVGSEGAVWYTLGNSVSNGEVRLLEVASGDIDTFGVFASSDAIEGLYYDRGERKLYVACDGWYHNGTTNRVEVYDIVPPLGPQFTFTWTGQALNSSPGGAVLIVGYGATLNSDIPTVGIYQKSGSTQPRILFVSNSALADFTLADATETGEWSISVDLDAGANGEATIAKDGVDIQTVGLSASVSSNALTIDRGLYVGGSKNENSGAYGRFWSGNLSAWGIDLNE